MLMLESALTPCEQMPGFRAAETEDWHSLITILLVLPFPLKNECAKLKDDVELRT